MATYTIHIVENITKSLIIEANTKEAAIGDAYNRFKNGQIVLDKENDSYTFRLYGNKYK